MSAEERLILASYFIDGNKLTDIAALLGVHESTVSRRLEKITAALNKKIRVALLKMGMNKREVEDAFSADVRELQVNVAERLKENSQKTEAGSFYTQRASGSKGPK
jgi:RNA polymerase sigma-70 factor (ECF subfamily)